MTQGSTPVLFPPLLLATDGSTSARFAQRLLYPISRIVQWENNGSGRSLVTVLTVQPRRSSRSNRLLQRIRPTPPEPGSAAQSAPSAPSPEATTTKLLAEPADQLTEKLQQDFPADLPAAVQIRQGRPATEILNYARTIQAGLIAVGSRGTGGVRELLLGSVSSVIARYAPCSVLIARGTGTDIDTEPAFNHILLVVNASVGTQTAIAATHQLIPAGVRCVTIVCVQPPLNADYLFGPFVAPNPSWQLNLSLQEVQREQSEQILNQARTALEQSDLEIQTMLQVGDPGPLICQIAQHRQVDLIILGSDANRRLLFNMAPLGRTLSQRSPLSSFRKQKHSDEQPATPYPELRNARLNITEDYIIHHAPCPVLLCRPR